MTTIAACMQPIVLECEQLHNLLVYVLDIEDDEDILSLASLVELFNNQHSNRNMRVDYQGNCVQIIAWVDDLDHLSTKIMVNSLSTLNLSNTANWLTLRGAVFTPGLAHVNPLNVYRCSVTNTSINEDAMTRLASFVINHLYPYSKNKRHIGLALAQTVAVLQFGNTFAWFKRCPHEMSYTLHRVYQVNGDQGEHYFITVDLLPSYRIYSQTPPGAPINFNGLKTTINSLEEILVDSFIKLSKDMD